MEIKKGISQMAEYPNVEINYVVPMDGQMYYVLRDGVLADGAVIATLDPKRAIDSNIVTDTIGVFAEDGSVLIDFDKKDIKKINDEFLLVVNSIPKSMEVINALKSENDEISKTMMKDNSTTIIDKMMIEMGITGEMLFSDAYSEANVYKTSGVNETVGNSCSFIGKNDKNFYFHTNDASTDTVVIAIDEEEDAPAPVAGFSIPTDFSSIPSVEPIENKMENVVIPDTSNDTKLDINQSIFGNFKPLENEISSIEIKPEESTPVVEEVQKDVKEEDTNSSFSISFDNNGMESEEKEIETNVENDISSEDINENKIQVSDENEDSSNDAVLDNAIAVMKKMIEETSKLNKRITELEEEIRQKDAVISREESKKSTLNDLLDEANEVLEKID